VLKNITLVFKLPT